MTVLLDNVLKPITEARGLPNEHYVSADMYVQEKETIFFKKWSAAAFDCDVPNAGDAYPVDFLGMPLLLVRDKNGALNVFQNTCRHRGMVLVSEPTHLKGPIRCPYHSWCYDLGGQLVRTPYVGGVGHDTHESVNPETLGLFKIRSHIWQGVVFVNISGDADAFDVEHAHLVQRWADFEKPYYVGGRVSQFEMLLDTNWKLAVENYCESYHLPWIHPELNRISKIDDHYHIEDHPGYAGQGSMVYRQLIGENDKKFPDFEGLSDIWNKQSEYVAFFPNVLLGVHRDHAFAMILMPQGQEKTRERVALFYANPDIDTPEWALMLKRNAEIWQGVFAEDVGVVEGMQKGRHGILFDGGKFSAVMDTPTHLFHKWVAQHMLVGE